MPGRILSRSLSLLTENPMIYLISLCLQISLLVYPVIGVHWLVTVLIYLLALGWFGVSYAYLSQAWRHGQVEWLDFWQLMTYFIKQLLPFVLVFGFVILSINFLGILAIRESLFPDSSQAAIRLTSLLSGNNVAVSLGLALFNVIYVLGMVLVALVMTEFTTHQQSLLSAIRKVFAFFPGHIALATLALGLVVFSNIVDFSFRSIIAYVFALTPYGFQVTLVAQVWQVFFSLWLSALIVSSYLEQTEHHQWWPRHLWTFLTRGQVR